MKNDTHYLKEELDKLLKSDSDIFSFIESSSLDGIWYWNLEKPEDEYMSPNFWKLFGYDPSKKKHLASEWQEMINKDDLLAAVDNVNKHLVDPNYPYDQLVRYTHKDGSTVWVRCRGIAIRNKDGKAIRMLGAHNDYTAIKRAEERERAKHQQLSSVLDASLDGIMAFESFYDKDGEIIDFVWTLSNKKACEIVGKSEADLLGKKLSEVMPGNFKPLKSLNNKSLFEYFKDVVKTGKAINLEFYFENDGLKDWFQNKSVKHGDGFVVTFNSITDVKNAKLALEKSEFQWRTAIEANGYGLWDWNLDTGEIYYSPQYKSMLGYRDDELENSLETFKKLCHPEHVEYVFDTLKGYLAGEIEEFDVKFQLRCKDGSYKWIQCKGSIANRSEGGEPLRVLGTHRDITKEYEKDIELTKLTKELVEAQRTAKLGSWSYDILEDTLSWSDGIFRIFGIDKELFEPSYENFISLIHPDDKEMVDKVFKGSVKNRKPYTVEHRVITHDGVEKFVREKGSTHYDADGKAVNTIGTVQDITDDIKQQQKLKEAKENAERANEAKSSFLANMSHEIRTPLNGIIGLTDLVLKTELNETQKEYLSKVKISSKALLHLINDILDYSKIEAGKLDIVKSEFSFEEILRSVNDLFAYKAYEKNIVLNLFFDHTIPALLLGDSLRLTQILNNLVGNALKFTSKGHVTLNVEKTSLDTKHKKVGLKICVEDSGIGISAEKQKRLFQAFEQGNNSTTKEYGGTGLGLMISKELVNMMGGEITMESVEGVGSKFCVDIRLDYMNKSVQKVLEHSDESDDFNRVLTETKRALVAEDNEINQIVIHQILQKLGFEVVIANNGQEALNMAGEKRYDIIFMDLQMPVMDGFKSAKSIREFDTKTPIYALSAAVMKEDKELTKDAGMDGHLAKPIDNSELYTVLQKHFEFQESQTIEDEHKQNSQTLYIEGIDINALKMRVKSDDKLIKRMLRQFYASHKETPQVLKESDIDSKEFKNLMHSLKGVTGNLSMSQLYKLSKEIYESKDAEFKALKLPEFIEELQSMLENIHALHGVKDKQTIPNISKDVARNILKKYMQDISSGSYIDDDQKDELYDALRLLADLDTAKKLRESIEVFDYSLAQEILEKVVKDTDGFN